MLDDDRATVDADNLAVGEGVSDYSCCLGVEVGLGVGGIEHRSVDDEEIGVGGWQWLSGFVVDGSRNRQLHQIILFAVGVHHLIDFLHIMELAQVKTQMDARLKAAQDQIEQADRAICAAVLPAV